METTLVTPSEALKENWSMIRAHFRRVIRKSTFVSIGTVRPDGSPAISPVGSFFLNDDCTGFYLEKFTTAIQKNAPINPRVTIMGVDPGRMFWLKSIFKGRFDRTPAIRLYGIAGERRPATEKETQRFLRLVRPLKGTKGYKIMWEDMTMVRVIRFEDFEPARLGKMTQHLSY